LALWYGHVELLKRHVVGQWFCLDRDSGSCFWDRRFWRINAIQAVADGVIVGSETRSDGPWTAGFGCYGIDLETGKLRWVSHRNGVWGKLVRMLDFFPGFTNELRDVPLSVEDRQVFCASGRVLDIQTGKLLRMEQHKRETVAFQDRSDAHRLYMTHNTTPRPDPIEVSKEQFISHRHPDDSEEDDGKPRSVRDRPLYGFDAKGTILWEFKLDSMGFFDEGNFFAYRLVNPYVYYVSIPYGAPGLSATDGVLLMVDARFEWTGEWVRGSEQLTRLPARPALASRRGASRRSADWARC
jgi:hypothetical protein